MAHFDFPLHELQTYQPRQTRQPDFEAFWRDTLAQSAAHPLDIHLDELDLPYTGARIARLSYAGWDGANIVGTYAVPAAPGPFPAVAIFHGYGSARPDPFLLLAWVSQGYAVLAVDVRGQSGESSDTTSYPGGHVPGVSD
ncbi:MAG: acetylxylan esterase, partial [Chloroflexaceae bacterium]|nr:acetylxylan esterase [Chloroflexaceae bacterium]